MSPRPWIQRRPQGNHQRTPSRKPPSRIPRCLRRPHGKLTDFFLIVFIVTGYPTRNRKPSMSSSPICGTSWCLLRRLSGMPNSKPIDARKNPCRPRRTLRCLLRCLQKPLMSSTIQWSPASSSTPQCNPASPSGNPWCLLRCLQHPREVPRCLLHRPHSSVTSSFVSSSVDFLLSSFSSKFGVLVKSSSNLL